MIVDLPGTTTENVAKRLVILRNNVGAMALSRVLTLVLVADEKVADEAIEVASKASRQHPCRIIAIVEGERRGKARIDAQIRVGGDAGASEVVVLRLYGPLVAQAKAVVTPLLLPDSPVVAWWPGEGPRVPGKDPIGAMAQRRITNIAAGEAWQARLKALAAGYAPGDTDLSWPRITLWRALLAAALDRPPYESVQQAVVTGGSDSPSAQVLAGWLAHQLGCPVRWAASQPGTGILSVRLTRKSGDIDLVRPDKNSSAVMTQPGQPERMLALAPRTDAECLADELRRLDPDEVYANALGSLGKIRAVTGRTMTAAVERGQAPSMSEARSRARKLARAADEAGASSMITAPLPTDAPVPKDQLPT